MVVYEVNLTVNQKIVNKFEAWLNDHIKEMLRIEGFYSAQWLTREPCDNEDGKNGLWTIQYFLTDRESLQNYFDRHAAKMRQDGMDRFGSSFSVNRRILYLNKKF